MNGNLFRSIAVALSFLVAIGGLAGCAAAPPSGGLVAKADTARSNKARITTPDVSADDLSRLAAGNTRFALQLYRALRGQERNLFFSPYSISVALAMTYAGGRGETEQQMAETLHFVEQSRLHPAFNGLQLELDSRAKDPRSDEARFLLRVANAIWGQKGFAFLPEFLDVLAQHYGSGLRLVDFRQAPEEARVIINEWVSEQTEGKIEDLLPPNAVDALTRLVLTNAIYFNASWLHPFEEELTKDSPFHLLDDTQINVPTMEQSESFGYAHGEGYQAVELPYAGMKLSMVILLPEAGRFQAFASSLDAERLGQILDEVQPRQVHLTLPRFAYDSEFSLSETLPQMGMVIPFTGDADFSGMTGDRDLFIDDVIHKAFVAVDEAGTEAAAATAVVMKLTAAPAKPVVVTVDRPFVFCIRDIPTGTILFLGQVVNPQP
jgi:serpin B